MKRTEREILRDVLGHYVALSPENLWMDGEATKAQARATERGLKKGLQKLFKELGREVSEDEAYRTVAGPV